MIKVLEHYNLEPSPAVQDAILLVGGLNRFDAPNYRLRWGWQCLELRGGEHVDYDDHGTVLRREVRHEWWPRYAPANSRFHLEVWRPPEFYGSPRQWQDQTRAWVRGMAVAQLGDYPRRGDYEHVATMESPDGSYVEPVASVVADMIRLHQRMQSRTPSEIRAGIRADEEHKKAERVRKYRDILDSEKVAFPWRTWVPVTGKNPRQLVS